MTDDAALREVAIHLLALEEHDEPDDATLTWARQASYGEGSEEHRGDCTKEAFTCRRCVRETREAQAAKLIDAYLAARGDVHREPLQEGRDHLTVSGTFQSDRYPTVPAGKVPLSVRDPLAQDLLWEYARRHREAAKHGDSEFPHDLEEALRNQGFVPRQPPSGEDK